MTKINTLFLVSLMVLLTACKKDNNLKGPAALVGRWKSTGGYVSAGGPQYFIKATNNLFVEFNADGSIGGNYYEGYKRYRAIDSVTIKFTKADTTKYITFLYRIKQNQLSLSPIAPAICIEGCSAIFAKED